MSMMLVPRADSDAGFGFLAWKNPLAACAGVRAGAGALDRVYLGQFARYGPENT
jgi:hypothetical protein